MRYFSLLLLFFIVPTPVVGATFKNMTLPFGGRVLTTELPGVTCLNPIGTAPVVLTSNLAGLLRAGTAAADGSQATGQRVTNIATGLYRAIPLYTWAYTKNSGGVPAQQPKQGDWILGRQKIVPNFSTCLIGETVPFPVVETDNFGITRSSSLGR